MQIIDGSGLYSKALTQWLRDIAVGSKRGVIVDRNGVEIASSVSVYDVYVRPREVVSDTEIANCLIELTDSKYDELIEKINKKNMSEVQLASKLSSDKMQLVLNQKFPGIYIVEDCIRTYNYDNMLCQLLGFVSSDGNGQSGLELYYNKYLKGVNGASLVESDNAGRKLSNSMQYYLEAIDGLNLQLTIDAKIQQRVDEIVYNTMLSTAATKASALVMNPKNGEILAMSIFPSYNLNEVPRDDITALMNMSKMSIVTDAYEPGSTFKIITTAIALEEGLTSEYDYFYCSGFRMVNGVKINCHRRTGHGSQSLGKGLSNSCNCVFMELISRIGINRFYDYLEKFGIIDGYNMAFPGEGKGITMPKNIATSADLYRMGFGQSVALTPMQLANSVSSIINGGTLFEPYIVSKIYNKTSTVYTKNPTPIRNVVSDKTATTLNKLLAEVVASGGGKNAKVEGYNIAGKTGTAQKYENNAIAQGKYIASFLGYMPADDPEYLVLVVIDEPKGAYYGGVVAAPVAQNIFEAIIEERDINKYKDVTSENVANIIVPDLYGKTLTEAVYELSMLGLDYLVDDRGSTTVTSQYKSAGSRCALGDIVLLIF